MLFEEQQSLHSTQSDGNMIWVISAPHNKNNNFLIVQVTGRAHSAGSHHMMITPSLSES